MIVGKNITDFIFKETYVDSEEIAHIQNIRLKNLECKHLAEIITPQHNRLKTLAEEAGHKHFLLGSHRNSDIEEEKEIIRKMAEDKDFKRSIRIVITSDGLIWSDNTHTTLAYMKRYGLTVDLGRVPFYVVNLIEKIPEIISVDNRVSDSLKDIKNAISSAKRLEERIQVGYRPDNLSFTIEDLNKQLISTRI
jgi:hypothetical protein